MSCLIALVIAYIVLTLLERFTLWLRLRNIRHYRRKLRELNEREFWSER